MNPEEDCGASDKMGSFTSAANTEKAYTSFALDTPSVYKMDLINEMLSELL